MAYPVQWVPQTLETVEGISRWETLFLTVSLSLWVYQPCRGGRLQPIWKHKYDKNILIIHTEWQWNEVQLNCPMVDEGMQNTEKWSVPESLEEPRGCLGFPAVPTIDLIYNHFLPIQYTLEVYLHLFWPWFPYNSTYQISQISLLFPSYKERDILWNDSRAL